jgi:hypothetical protein
MRHREHKGYQKNPISAYALHILNNRHEYGNWEKKHAIRKDNELLGVILHANVTTAELIDR